jgi:hypothetical protein
MNVAKREGERQMNATSKRALKAAALAATLTAMALLSSGCVTVVVPGV